MIFIDYKTKLLYNILNMDILDYTRQIRADLVNLGFYREGEYSPEIPSDYHEAWKCLRDLSSDTQISGPAQELCYNNSPSQLTTEFGYTALKAVMSYEAPDDKLEYGSIYACISAEPGFIASSQQITEPESIPRYPIIIEDSGDDVALLKADGEPTLLGLLDDDSIGEGVISKMLPSPYAQTLLDEIIYTTRPKGITRINLAELLGTGVSIHSVRVSNFMYDQTILDKIGRFHIADVRSRINEISKEDPSPNKSHERGRIALYEMTKRLDMIGDVGYFD